MITLSYPYTSPTISVVLRNPNIGDIQRLDQNNLIRRSTGGQLQQAGLWLGSTSLSLTFSEISATKKAELIVLFAASRGKIIKYIDYESVTWMGIITTEDIIFKTIPGLICPLFETSFDLVTMTS
jgi:hypothetical protein